VFDTQTSSEYRVVVIRNIPGGVHRVDRRSAPLVNEDTVLGSDWRTSNEIHVRFDSDADDREIAGDPPTALCQDTLDALAAFECHHRILEDHVDPVVAMNSSQDAADLFAEHAKERRWVRIDDDDFNLFLTQGCDNFGADEPHPDDHRVASFSYFSAKGIRIADCAQIVDALEIEAGQREPAGPPPGCPPSAAGPAFPAAANAASQESS